MPDEKTEKTAVEVLLEKTKAALDGLQRTPGPAGAYNDKMIAALLRERAGLVAQSKADRVAEVDAQLEHYGYTPDGTKAEASDDGKAAARKQPPQGRSSKPQQAGD